MIVGEDQDWKILDFFFTTINSRSLLFYVRSFCKFHTSKNLISFLRYLSEKLS